MKAIDFLDGADDLGSSQSAESFLDAAEPKKQNKGILGDIGTGLKRGVEQMPGMVTGIADVAAAPVSAITGVNRPFSKAADYIGEKTGFQPGKWAEQAAQEYSPEMQQSLQNVEKADGFTGTLKAIAENPRSAVNLVAESLPSTLAGGILARGAMGAAVGAEKLAAMKAAGDTAGLMKAGAIAGGIGEGAVTAGQQMSQTDYNVDPLRAAGSALAAGAGTGIIGGVSGRIANKIGLADIEGSIAAGTLGAGKKAGAGAYAGRIAGGAVQEGALEEMPQSAQEQVWQNVANSKPWDDGVGKASAQGLVAGMAMGAGVNALPGSKYAESKRTPPAADKPEIAGLLPAPNYTGTPSDQLLQAEVGRQNSVDAAQKNADQLYAERAAYEKAMQALYPSGLPTLTTDPEPLQQRIDAMLGIDPNGLKGLRKVQYQKQLEAAFSEVVGITHDADGREKPLTMGALLDSQAMAEDASKRQIATENANTRAQGLADEEATQQPDIAPGYVPPVIQVVGPLSAIANAAVQSGAHQTAVMQQAAAEQAKVNPAGPLSTIAKQSEQTNGPIATQAAAQVATPGNQAPGGELPGGGSTQHPAFDGSQGRIGNSAEVATPGMQPAAVAAYAGEQAPNAVSPAATAGDPFIQSRSDAQLNWLAERGKPELKAAAVAEIQQRQGNVYQNLPTPNGELQPTAEQSLPVANEQQAGSGLPASTAGGSRPAPVANQEPVKNQSEQPLDMVPAADAVSQPKTDAAPEAKRKSSQEWVDEGKTPDQLRADKVDSLAMGLAGQVAEEASQSDFDPSEMPAAVRAWAEDDRVPSDELRQALLKRLAGFDISKMRMAQIRRALDPTRNSAPVSTPKASRNKIDPEKDSLFVAIAKAGGMDTDELLSNGIDSNDITFESAARVKKDGQLSKKRRMPISFGFALPLHKKGGMSFDAMRETMQQYGYLPEIATKNDAIDLFQQELGGNPVYTAKSIEFQREQDQEAFDKMMMEEQDRIDAELAAREIAEDDSGYNELSDEAQSLADDFAEIAFGENGKQDEHAIRAGMRALGFTEKEINDELAKNSQAQRESEEIAAGPGQESGAGRDGNRAEDAQARERDGQEGFGLAGQTNREAAAEFKRQQEEEAKKDEAASTPSVKADQVDLFNTQDSLFNSNRDAAPVAKAAEQAPAVNAKGNDSDSLSQEMAGFTGVSDAEYALRQLSHKEKQEGDIELGNGKFVTLEQAVEAAKKSMDRADWSKPFQFSRILDIAPIDWNTMVGAMKNATVDAKKPDEAKAEIADFGEKLGGARKDQMPSMDAALSDDDIATQPLSKIWPANEIDAIEDPFVAAVAYAARAEVPAKPRVAYKVARWVEKVKTVRNLAQRILDGSIAKDRFAALMKTISGLDGFAAKVALLEAIDRKHWGRIGYVREYPDAYRYGENGEKIASPSVYIRLDDKHKEFPGAKSVADIIEQITEALGDGAQAKKMQFEVRGKKGSYSINKKGDKEYRILKTFADSKEAFAFIKDNYADLVAAWDGVKESDNVSKTDVRNEENRPRTGKDRRDGKDVTPEQFSYTFGFRGVEFGLWVKQGGNAKDRQGMLNQAFDAMHDLAEIVGIPPKAISLNGTLGLGFGSRGKGAASAHFEPGNLVINLTKTRGAGTLAHEWFHAMDNYFARMRNNGNQKTMAEVGNVQEEYRRQNFVTYKPEPLYIHKTKQSTAITRAELARYHAQAPGSSYYDPANWHKDPSHPEGVRTEVESAFAELVNTLNAAPMARRARLIDKAADGYWSRIIERGARSFENYIITKMMEGGYNNDYLANVRPIEDFPRSKDRYPYLLPDEVAPIAEAFDGLFSTLQTKETEQGVMLYNQASAGKISPADKAIYGMAAEGKSAAEVLKFIASASRNPFNRQVARLLLKTGISPAITVGDGKGWKMNAGDGNKYAAAYNPKSDTVSLFRPASAERNMLHEMMHAATLKALAKKGMASAQMNALYRHVKKSGKLKGMYGMSDVDEFIAESFSNPKFQAMLKQVSAAPVGGKPSSAWDWFIRVVRGVLGLKQGQDNALSQALDIGIGVMRENMKAGEVEGDTRYSQSAMKSIDANIRRGRFSLAKAVAEKTSVHRAMFRNGLGWVDFVWGDEGTVKASGKTKGAMGLSHILEARARKDGMSGEQISQLLDNIVSTIANGKEIRRYEFDGTVNATIERDGVEAVLTKSAGANVWLLNGWNVKNPGVSGVGNVTTRPTSSTPTTTQRGDGAGFNSNIADQNEDGNGIRYNVADEGWSVSEPSKLDDVIYAMQDKQIDMKRVMQSIMKTGKQIKDSLNPYLQEELFHGRASNGVKDFLDFELRPLLKEMQQGNIDMGDFEEYLWNAHAQERNEQIAKVNPEMKDGGSGIKTADAKAYLAALSPELRGNYQALAARVNAINKASQKALVDSGLEKQETIDAWNGAYQHYVPLQREDVDSGHIGTGKGFSIRGSSTKRALGSGRKVVDIIANLTMQRERNIVRAEKNRVTLAVRGLAMDNPNADFWTVDEAPKERVIENKAIYTVMDSEGRANEFTRMADAEKFARSVPGANINQTWQDRVTERVVPGFSSRDNVLLARVNGEDKYVIFNERDTRAMRMVLSLKNLDMDNMGRVLSLIGKATRYLSAINTQYNPVFGVINLIRDTQGALVNLSSTPLAGDQKRVLGYTTGALIGIYKDIRAHRQGKVPSSNWAALFEEFQKEGGQTGYRDQYANAEARAESIISELKQIKEGKPKRMLRGVFGWLSDYNDTMENAVRLAAYKVAKEKGMSKQQAASLAKNLTVNFNRKGQVATQVGALYAFFNASMQGSARLAQTLFEANDGDIKSVRLSKTGKKILVGGIMLGSMQALLLAAAGFGDDEPPDFIRERNLILPIGDGKYLTLAMPLGLHVIPGIGRIATEFVLGGGKDPLKHMAAFAGMFAESFNPIGSAGFSLQTIAPSVIDPFAALAENRDFTGKEIYRENRNAMSPTPGHARAKDVATFYSRWISEGLNFITGGTEFKPGMLSWSPDSIDYLVGQVTGGVGREVNKVVQTAGSTWTGEDLPLYKIPLVGRFVGDTAGQSGESAKFYDAIKQINMHENQMKGLREERRFDEAREYAQENPAVRLIMAGNHAERSVQKLRSLKRELIKDDADQSKVKAIDDRITAAMRSFNERATPLI